MRRLTIELTDVAFGQLHERAEAERRGPRDEAGILLERLLLRQARAVRADRTPARVLRTVKATSAPVPA